MLTGCSVIAISGLGSHPFGSWQRHGSDKSYMWIRDEIPGSIPGARAILYGYDASLTDSDSFQSIRDIARGLFEQLRATGWQRVAAASLAFLAHSLGGIVLMDALLQIADSRNSVDAPILDKVRGAILFGVPTLGMEQSNLQAMTEGQVNETIVQDLSRESNYLRNLNESYLGVSRLRRLRVFWGYETRTSPTVEVCPSRPRCLVCCRSDSRTPPGSEVQVDGGRQRAGTRYWWTGSRQHVVTSTTIRSQRFPSTRTTLI